MSGSPGSRSRDEFRSGRCPNPVNFGDMRWERNGAPDKGKSRKHPTVVFLRDWWQAMIAECPFEATRDDRKSAALAAERMTVRPDARVVSGLAFARELL